MAKEPFKPQLRLVVQASIPISCEGQGDNHYIDLRVFLQSLDPNITLNGQIMKMLEPCCKDKPKGDPHGQNP